MKLQIDIDKKTITPLEDVNIGDLMKALGKLFPEEAFKEYTLLRGLKENELPWINPLVVPYPNPTPSLPWIQPFNQPYSQPYIGGTGSGLLNGGNTLTNVVSSPQHRLDNGIMWSYYNVEVTNLND